MSFQTENALNRGAAVLAPLPANELRLYFRGQLAGKEKVFSAMPDVSASPDNLIPFFELVGANQKANIARFPSQYVLIRRVNICLSTAGQKLINPEPLMCAVLFLRCQYAYKAAAGMALSGQAVEAFVMLRSCLEYAGYALAIFNDPSLEIVFSNRHVTSADMQAQKQAFRISEIKKVIEAFDPKLADLFQIFYNRSIDFGGHPNPHATFSAMEMPSDGSVTALAMVTDPQIVQHAMKSVAQVGLTALFIFQHIFKAKFELLGIRAEMDKLRLENL